MEGCQVILWNSELRPGKHTILLEQTALWGYGWFEAYHDTDQSTCGVLACARFGLDVISVEPLGLAETETDIHSGELNPVDHETILFRVGSIYSLLLLRIRE